METRASHVLVGAFALVIITAGALFALWLGRLRFAESWQQYDVVFQEPVTGLIVGSSVQYSGLLVGEVRRLSLDPDDPGRVIARVRVAASTPVRTDTRARLAFTGLTGVAAVQFLGGTRSASALRASRRGLTPRLLAEDSEMQKLLSSGAVVLSSAQQVLQRLTAALSPENLDRIGATLDHVERLSGRLARHENDIGTALQELAGAATSLRRVLARSEGLVARLSTLAVSSDRVLNGEARQALDSARRLADRASAVLDENRAAIVGFSGGDLRQVGPALRDLREAVRAVRDVSEQLKNDPQSLLMGQKERPRERVAP